VGVAEGVVGAVTTRLLTIDEVAERLRVSKRTAYRIAKEIVCAPGSPVRIAEIEVERYIATRMRGTPEERHPLAQLLVDEVRAARAALPSCCMADGFVYFVGHGELVKVGRSKTANLELRMASLQCQSPVALRLLALSRGYDLESRLHELWRQQRAHGEWFWRDSIAEWLAPGWPCIRCRVEALR